MAKQRNRKDLDLLLEKRMELLSSENEEKVRKTSKHSSSSSSGVKRKSTENSSSVKHSRTSDSKTSPRNDKKQMKSESSPVKPKLESKIESPPPVLKEPVQAMIVMDDPEYAQKMEEQKKKREQMLKLKEEKRNQRVLEMKKNDERTVRTVIESDSRSDKQQTKRIVTSTVKAISVQSPRRLIIQNLTLNTTENYLLNMCNSLNLKDKVKLNKICNIYL